MLGGAYGLFLRPAFMLQKEYVTQPNKARSISCRRGMRLSKHTLPGEGREGDHGPEKQSQVEVFAEGAGRQTVIPECPLGRLHVDAYPMGVYEEKKG